MKQIIRLTESDLHKIIKKSINEILGEWGAPDPSDYVGRKGYDPDAPEDEEEENELDWDELYYKNK